MAEDTVKKKRGRPAGRDAQATRAMIVRSARELFGIHGYSATTVRMIAQRAGISIQAYYYHFSGIETVYDEVVSNIVERMEKAVLDVLAEPTLRAQLRTYAFAMHEIDYEDRSVMAFILRENLDARRHRRLGDTTSSLMTGTDQFFTALVAAAVERGELAADIDARAVVGMLASIMWGVGLYAGFVPVSDDMAPVTNRVDEIIANGLPFAAEPAPRLVG
jgi:AcrR family transcriptional regulator